MNNKLLPVKNINEIFSLGYDTSDLIGNGHVSAYYAVVVYMEKEEVYIQNQKIKFSDRLFELLLYVAKAGIKGIKAMELSNKMKLDYNDVYQYIDRINEHKKYKNITEKPLIINNEKGFWHLNLDYTYQGLLLI